MRLSRRCSSQIAAVLVLACLAGLAAPGFAADEGGPGMIRRAMEAVCSYNRSLLEEACEVFRIRQGRLPVETKELRDLFIREPRCPAGGKYALASDGRAGCSIHDRTEPGLLTLQVFPAQPSGAPGATPRSVFRRDETSTVVFLARWRDDGLTHLVEVAWTDPDGQVVKSDAQAWQRKPVVQSRLPLGGAGRGSRPLRAGTYCVQLRLDNRSVGSCTFILR